MPAHTNSKSIKKQRPCTEGRLNQCISLQVFPFPRCPVMLHTALSGTSIPLVASLCLPAGFWCANLLRVWVVVLIISAQRHGHGWFSHTVQLTANWHGCSLLLLLLLLPLSGLQPSLPPSPKLHNTTSRCRKHRQACLINMDRLPEKEEGCLEAQGQWEAAVHQSMYWGSLPLSNEERKCRQDVVIFMMSITGKEEQVPHSQ